MADTLAFGATAPASLPSTRPSRWEARQAVRTGVPADIKIYSEGARPSVGALATVHVRDGREHKAAALARLIAAAPELLDVLRLVVDEFCRDGFGLEFEDGDHPYVDQARALLARLEGGAA